MDNETAKFQQEAIAPMHTCEHVVNRVMMNLFGCGRAVEAHIERKKSKMDFALPAPLTEEDIRRIGTCVNEVLHQNLPVTYEYISQMDAARRFDLKRLPEGVSGQVRVVHVGTFDECLCIGRHVANTAEVGTFRILSTDWKEGLLRIRFKLQFSEP